MLTFKETRGGAKNFTILILYFIVVQYLGAEVPHSPLLSQCSVAVQMSPGAGLASGIKARPHLFGQIYYAGV